MYFKKLVGEKCYLSPIDAKDTEKFAEWLNDLEVTVNLPWYTVAVTVESEKSIFDNLSGEHYYSIIDNEANELIGLCCFTETQFVNQTGEVGIFIGNKNYWNKGYGTEALSLLLDYGFKALNLHNIMVTVNDDNKRALKVYEKIGFKQIGIRREALQRDLKRQNVIYMDILSHEFYEAL